MKHFKHDRGQALRGYLAAFGRVLQELGQGLETGIENLGLEPGQQFRLAMRFAQEASVRVTPDALLRLDHVNGEPDQVVAQNAGPLVFGRV
jgi:hypothetical protein